MNKHIIRTSDRKSFKKCRQAWDFGSPLRQNLKPKQPAGALELGTAVHAGLQVYYDPDLWTQDRMIVEALVIKTFHDAMEESWSVYKEMASVEAEEEYKANVELGDGMLKHYLEWAPTVDKFTPKLVEVEFEVSIKDSDGNPLVFFGDPVVYQGRIDLIIQDEDGKYWIVDHKTAKNLADQTGWLDMDEQVGSYAWAIQEQLGVRVEGVLYNELRKDVPHPPRMLNNGDFSRAKNQNTTYALYKQTLAEYGRHQDDYFDILEHLQDQGNKFFRRYQCHRSQRELELLGERIALEAFDMLDNPSIYPNPTRINCSNCAYQKACLMKMDGSDYTWYLKENYVLGSGSAMAATSSATAQEEPTL